METKSIFASKTFWINLFVIVAMVATNLGVDIGLDDVTKTEIATGIVAFVNLILRFVTSTSVTVTGK